MGASFQLSRNPLAYPVGCKPGFDASHVAGAQVKFSGVATPGNFIDVGSGGKGTISGTPTTGVHGQLGPVINFPSGAYATFPGHSAIVYPSITIAAIFSVDSLTTFQYIFSNSTGGTGLSLIVDTTFKLAINNWETTRLVSSLAIAAATPYFAVVSQNGTTSTQFLLMDLRSGKVLVETQAAGLAVPTSLSGSYLVSAAPNTGSHLLGNVAAAMYSGIYLSLPTMLAWAADPWSFWYPDRNDAWIAAQAAAGLPRFSWQIH